MTCDGRAHWSVARHARVIEDGRYNRGCRKKKQTRFPATGVAERKNKPVFLDLSNDFKNLASEGAPKISAFDNSP
jgi:IS5 family transposase